MKYRKLTGIVLKKQNFKEADQIATVYTQETGKIRCVAKSLRLSKSKLSGSFQDFSLVSFEVTNGKALPVLISSKVLESFNGLKTDLKKMAMAFYASELAIKLTADEQGNPASYELLLEFFRHLDRSSGDEAALYAALDNFSLRFLSSLGFSMEFAKQSMRIPQDLSRHLHNLQASGYGQLKDLAIPEKAVHQIHKVVSQFVEYILERNIKSESFLTSI